MSLAIDWYLIFGNVMLNIENIKQNTSKLLTWTPGISLAIALFFTFHTPVCWQRLASLRHAHRQHCSVSTKWIGQPPQKRCSRPHQVRDIVIDHRTLSAMQVAQWSTRHRVLHRHQGVRHAGPVWHYCIAAASLRLHEDICNIGWRTWGLPCGCRFAGWQIF